MSQSVAYGGSPYNGHGCKCGAHRQHRLLRYLWANPRAPQAAIAHELKISESNVREGLWRLRQRNLSRTCPECFAPKLFGGVCQNCGFEPDAPSLPIEVMPDSQSPTNHLHAGNLLGSVTDYKAVGFTNAAVILKRKIEGSLEDPLVAGVKSDVENELKRDFPEEAITDEAGRLVIKEVAEFRARYPGLRPKGLRMQIALNVMARLRLLHPQLREVRVLAHE